MMFLASSLLVSQALQVVGHLVASSNEEVEESLLDGVDTGASGEEGAVGGAVDDDGFVGLFALEFLCTEDDAEGVGKEDGGVGCEVRGSGHGRRFRRPLLRLCVVGWLLVSCQHLPRSGCCSGTHLWCLVGVKRQVDQRRKRRDGGGFSGGQSIVVDPHMT
ncbi:hypothetical protein AUEXF2481DRAFT_409511 [Aureobasidium subglaciale EXF-2481]|uniref:Secreted protein n=1 Tax=Aureobasidium subglaciale (strain EXF-2481) TaxID=1043005 RepID=A0A074YYK8_AURSE|nr:uncharacterized protein AUEXF2481DRAFT_409511 [Aureobasidium subglaciale EXF-2481]KEQ99257.1 hypothetical protein AUEXF2481DRAFT_409511 [Aureobasidium subglaciale EXF-2481]